MLLRIPLVLPTESRIYLIGWLQFLSLSLPMYNSYRYWWVCTWLSWLWCECQLCWQWG